ncbi:MAG: polyketide synthase dehydratase domain-containing protein, partial [Myxococcales bacterium]|nr:polyketide synthase dehydratase domain-containing protein [Myxococcales bacterium]
QASFAIHVRDPEGARWERAVIGRYEKAEPAPLPDPRPEPRADAATLDHAAFYRRLNAGGNHWGPSFQAIQRLHRRPGEVLAEIAVPPSIRAALGHYAFHPALLDACGHALIETFADDQRGPFVMAEIATAQLFAAPREHMWARVRAVETEDPRSATVDVEVHDDDGRLLARLRGLRVQFLHAHGSIQRDQRRDDHYIVAWEPAATSVQPLRPTASDVVLRFDHAQVHDDCRRTIEALRDAVARGHRLWLVTRGAVDAGGTRPVPAATALWGLAQTLAVEHPAIFAGLIDLDPGQPVEDDDPLQQLFARGLDEQQVALREGRQLVARLRPVPKLSAREGGFTSRLRPDAAYLITGGLG